MPTINLSTDSKGLKAISEVIESLVPGLDLSMLEKMTAAFSVAAASTIDLVLTTKQGPVQLIVTLTP